MSSGAGQEARSESLNAAVKKLETGIELFHADRIAEARSEFEAVIAAGAEGRLTSRAGDYLAACDRAEAAKDGKGDDAFLEAVMARNDGELESALKICTAGSRTRDGRFVYLASCIRALQGEAEPALDSLAKAVELDPTNRVRAFHDADFASLNEDERFLSLVHDHSDGG
ncbi:MAG: hypothetical protein OYL92_00120 [Acidobacteriota bacterium]|nr:hypothetical protein [Acidobacteriota bacterium]MDE2922793.1 hypothetical protein [Acidobacteriota bacterium]MDE3263349.1 hypothetical protein [Acidobacteriota bacterium]